jgi:hypothetical protein
MGFKKIQNFTQNLYVLAYSFTENHQFTVKTDRNSVFLGREAYILNRLYIMVPYMSFYRFQKKNQILVQNSSVLAYGFTKNCQFAIKIDRNSVFLGHKACIPDWLYIMLPYMSFSYLKKSIFAQNT